MRSTELGSAGLECLTSYFASVTQFPTRVREMNAARECSEGLAQTGIQEALATSTAAVPTD